MIGLVITGTGERALANIGVLKALEQMRVPIDAIAASGVGAVIGAAYASGLSTEELEQIFLETNWQETMGDMPVSSYLERGCEGTPERVAKCLEKPLSPTMLSAPELLSGRKLDLYLQALVDDSRSENSKADFDDLAIPFRIVATNLETMGTLVIDSGSLARAAKTGMTPLDPDSLIEFDGHVAADIPGFTGPGAIPVIRDMGADVTILVDIQQPLIATEELRTREIILEHVVISQGKAAMYRQLESFSAKDFYIAPEVGEYLTGDITRYIEAGTRATLRFQEPLSKFALSEAEYEKLMQERNDTRK